jgi:hypothetical protein
VALALAAAVLLGFQVFSSSLLEDSVARDLQDRFALEERPEVNLESEGPFALLSGSFTGGRIVMVNPDLDGVRPERVSVDLEPFDVDVLGSATGGAVKSEDPVSGALTVEVPERELLRLAQAEAQEFPVDSIELEEGRAVIGSRVSIFGTELPVVVEGDAGVSAGAFRFVPQQATAGGVELPQELNEVLLENASLDYPIEIPIEGRITGGEVLRDRLVLNGEAENLL